jgi:phosphatidylserine decarboxylase
MNKLRIAREGISYILIPAVFAALVWAIGYPYVAAIFCAVSAFMAFFFRDPKRELPSDPNVIVAPADGKVTRVTSLTPDSSSARLISIFLSPLDVHINRAPIAGRITNVSYTKGKFLMATNNRASIVNEQNALTIEGEQITVVCKQIAGILARRIICWKSQGERLRLGERFGLIKFSSRTDLILPDNVEVLVSEGMKVKGGSTIVGRTK